MVIIKRGSNDSKKADIRMEEMSKALKNLVKKLEKNKEAKVSLKKLPKTHLKIPKTHLKINTSPMGYKPQIRAGRIPQSTINRIEQNMPNNILSRPSDNYNLLRQKKLFTRGD